jgi:hypothetical protein
MIWVGSNDVNNNETSTGHKRLKDFINHRNNTNITALAAPHGQGLQETPRINLLAPELFFLILAHSVYKM